MDQITDKQNGFSRPIVVHYHIYKNAGTSVDWCLEKAFGKSWVNVDLDSTERWISNRQLSNYAEKNLSINALSSHLARPERTTANVYPILFLRNPIVRAYSAYLFARRDPSQPDHHVASSNDFAGYVEWSLFTPDVGVVIKNYQVVHLSSCSRDIYEIQKTEVHQNNLDEAVDLLECMPGFGLVNKFDESCKKFNHLYKKIFHNFEMLDVQKNQSFITSPPDSVMISLIRKKIGDRLYNELINKNTFDLELFRIANILFRSTSRTDI